MSAPEKTAIIVPAFNEPGIETTLDGLYRQHQRDGYTHHFVVDNGSTDNTREYIERFARNHDDFPLSVVEESQKGTGAASDTGFRTAIDSGYAIIARTDADTVPMPDWTAHVSDNFSRNETLQLLGGKSLPLHDDYYRPGDYLLLPMAVRMARIALTLKHLDRDYLSAVVGHNMATRAEAYQSTGGFERSSIDEMDEDIDYSLKVAAHYGRSSIRIDPELTVQTSMRRMRKYGLAGTAIHHLFPDLRKNRRDAIDIR